MLSAIAEAEAIVIGPSNPVISIGPILAVPGMREALAAAAAPVVAVSPFVGGRAVKGPTESFCAQAGIELSAAGIVAAYDGVLDGIVADEDVSGLPALRLDTLMDTPADRRRVAASVLEFGPLPGPMRTLAILPVKTFGAAKQRLSPALPVPERRSLAEAMLARRARVAGARRRRWTRSRWSPPTRRARSRRGGRRPGPRRHRPGAASRRPR